MLETQKFVSVDINGLDNVNQSVISLLEEIEFNSNEDVVTSITENTNQVSENDETLFNVAVYINANPIDIANDLLSGTTFNSEAIFPLPQQ
jgi:hypothetical protein